MHCPVGTLAWGMWLLLGGIVLTRDPSSQASGDTKRHYNDGGGIKQVSLPSGRCLLQAKTGPACPQELCLTCHITGGRLRVSHGMKHFIIILPVHHGNLLFQAGTLHKKLPTSSRVKHLCVLLGDGFRG